MSFGSFQLDSSDSDSSRLSSLDLSSFNSSSTATTVTVSGNSLNDKRVRIAMLPNSPAIFYRDSDNPLLYNYLEPTNGVVFPYQPKVDISFSANYQSQKVTQSNFTFYSYENSEIKPFDISCDFPARNVNEGRYVLAAMTFLRSITFSFTGNDSNVGSSGINLAGSPPLVVSLQGMGFGGLDYFPIVVSNVTTSYRDDVDYISVDFQDVNNLAGELIKIPILTTISVSCIPVFSRAFASQFSTIDYSTAAQRLLGPNGYSQPSSSSSSTSTSSTSSTTDDNSAVSAIVTANPTTIDTESYIYGGSIS
ncbi:Uncharacterised protein [uncultured archaeon]|nr:Uncharacterised protein [uncultured archaeon]